MKLKERIIRRRDGTIIFCDSFDEYDDEYVGNVCSELVKEGTLIRLSQGIYYKPVKTWVSTCSFRPGSIFKNY